MHIGLTGRICFQALMSHPQPRPEGAQSREACEREDKGVEVVPKALDCVQPCCRFPQVQPAARFSATKSPSSTGHVTVRAGVTLAAAGCGLFKAAAGLHAVPVQGLRHCFCIPGLALMRFAMMLMLLLHPALNAEPAAVAQPTAPNNPLALPKGFAPEQLVEEKPRFPKAMYIDGPDYNKMGIPNLERFDAYQQRDRRTFLIPKGASVVSGRAKVTSSVKPDKGTLDLITDGDADGVTESVVEFAAGLQWVQVDLGSSHHIWKILLWHFHGYGGVYYDVVVQVSDDSNFASGVRTIFNNDHDNSSGLGRGLDPTYLETCSGRLIDGCGGTGRYLRFYSNGGLKDPVNRYTEVTVYGSPASSAASASAPNNPLALPTGFAPEELVLMKPDYPKPQFVSDVVSGDILKQPNFEKWDPEAVRKRLSFLVPKGAANVARGKKVTGSDPAPDGDYALFTDGIAAGNGTSAVQLDPGTQWVQVDLGERCHIWKILLWLHYQPAVVCHDVIVQVSDDRQFATGVTTLFNNDHDNSSGLGRGVDPAYVEMHLGRLIDGCASEATGRHVRFYARGSTSDPWNQFLEVSIYGSPVATPAH